MEQKVVGIIQARMGSTRLPGKVLKKVLGKPLLELQWERLKRVPSVDWVVATTISSKDDEIVSLCEKLHIPYYRGSEEDVLSRYFEIAKEYLADIVIRITADNPLIDPAVIRKGVEEYLHGEEEVDYVSNCLTRSYPVGMDTEVFSFDALKRVYLLAKEKKEREHVTLYFYEHPDLFKCRNFLYPEGDFSKIRLTVDREEDFIRVKKIYEELYPLNPSFSLENILEVIHE